jgi:hypothetical protein
VKRSTEETLREARTHFELMSRHAQGDLTDQLVIDAICMRLSAGIEALGRLESTRRDRLFGDAWPIIWGMRNASHMATCSSAPIPCAWEPFTEGSRRHS